MEQDLINIFMEKKIEIRVHITCRVLTLVLKHSLWNKSISDFMFNILHTANLS